MKLNKEFKKVCEEKGWNVSEYNYDLILQKYSPAGEDFYLSIDTKETKNTKKVVKEIRRQADDFDIDDHVEIYIGMRGKKGVPSSISTLLKDAEDIKEMIEELAEELEKNGKN